MHNMNEMVLHSRIACKKKCPNPAACILYWCRMGGLSEVPPKKGGQTLPGSTNKTKRTKTAATPPTGATPTRLWASRAPTEHISNARAMGMKAARRMVQKSIWEGPGPGERDWIGGWGRQGARPHHLRQGWNSPGGQAGSECCGLGTWAFKVPNFGDPCGEP